MSLSQVDWSTSTWRRAVRCSGVHWRKRSRGATFQAAAENALHGREDASLGIPGKVAELGADVATEAEIMLASDQFAPEGDLVLGGDGAQRDGAEVGTGTGDAGLALGSGGEGDGCTPLSRPRFTLHSVPHTHALSPALRWTTATGCSSTHPRRPSGKRWPPASSRSGPRRASTRSSCAILAIQGSRMGLYGQLGRSGTCVRLRDLAAGDRLLAFDPVSHAGPAGEAWYARVLPAPLMGGERHVAVTTPYVLTGVGAADAARFMWRAATASEMGGRLRGGPPGSRGHVPEVRAGPAVLAEVRLP